MAIAAFTATADLQTQQTIQAVLGLERPDCFRCSPYRPNLQLLIQTAWTPRGRRQQLLKFIRAHPQKAGLIYTRSRRDAEALATWLGEQGYQTAAYHAGLGPEARRFLEAAWLQGEMSFVVCTCAFGMGINKSDCRWVAHFHPPLTLCEYIQEIGRAGRDGKRAIALTLMSEPTGWLDPEDQQRRRFFVESLRSQQQAAQRLGQKLPAQGSVSTVARQFKGGAVALALLHATGQLTWHDPFHYSLRQSEGSPGTQRNQAAVQSMTSYLSTRQCRWQFLLQAFGFAVEANALRCGHCDNCRKYVSP